MHTNNFKHRTLSVLSIATLGLLMAACGGGGGDKVGQITNKPGTGGGSSSSAISDEKFIGLGSGNDFNEGVIGIDIGNGTLSAGGTTYLTINIVNADKALASESIDIIFNSRCIAAKESLLSETPTTTINGQASVSYTANGCVGEDEITATASFNGQILKARNTIIVEADTVTSIQFVDASPQQISLKGTGGSEISNVRFLVKGNTGIPVKGACVEFSLNTYVGGLNLVDSKCDANDTPDAKRAKTNEEGYASIFVQSGTVATPVAVTAKLINSGLSTQSRELRVSTGVPEQKSMSLSASIKNPNAWDFDGEKVDFTIRLADAFNNPPSDGTSVSFTTSGGSITPNCITKEGVCSVTWTSQNPRPESLGQVGHVRILAHTTGNESFIDVNGNGWYDYDADLFASGNPSCLLNVPPPSEEGSKLPCDDLGEAFLDRNHNGYFDSSEWFVDFNQDGTQNTSDGLYNGILCREQDVADLKCTRNGVTIRRDYLIIMSSNQPYLLNGRLVGQPAQLPITGGTFQALLADQHLNPLPFGTKVELDTSNAKNIQASPRSLTIPSTHSTQFFPAIVNPDGQEPPSGHLIIHITTPDGLTTSTAPIYLY